MEEPARADELDLRHYARVLRRQKVIIFLVTLGMVAAAVLASKLQTPVYQAQAEILLQSRLTDSVFGSNGGSGPARTVETEVRVINSDAVRRAVREKLGAAPPISANRVGETEVMMVRALSTGPEQAATVANAYAEAYVSYRRSQAVDDVVAAGEAIRTKIDAIQSELTDIDRQARQAPPPEQAAAEARTRPRYASLLSQQGLLQQKLDEVQVDASLKSGGAQLVVVANTPTKPVKPQPVRNALAAMVVGLLAGLGLAFLRDRLDDSIKSTDDLRQAEPDLPVLGAIPVISSLKTDSPVQGALASGGGAMEAYRGLRTSLQLLGIEHPIRVVQITSPMAGEGKTSTVASLGLVLAAAGQRVVMVDCDLRRPRLHKLFGLSNQIGFTSVFVGEVPVKQAVQAIAGQQRLFLLASGPIPPNPSEILSSARASQLLSRLKGVVDVVLIDSAPVLPVTDATVLATAVDATLVVVRADVTTSKELADAVALIRRADVPTVGTILNQAGAEATYGYGTDGVEASGTSRGRRRFGRRRRKHARSSKLVRNDDVPIPAVDVVRAAAGTPALLKDDKAGARLEPEQPIEPLPDPAQRANGAGSAPDDAVLRPAMGAATVAEDAETGRRGGSASLDQPPADADERPGGARPAPADAAAVAAEMLRGAAASAERLRANMAEPGRKPGSKEGAESDGDRIRPTRPIGGSEHVEERVPTEGDHL